MLFTHGIRECVLLPSGIFLLILLQDSTTLLHIAVDTHSTAVLNSTVDGCVGSFHFVTVTYEAVMEHSGTHLLVNMSGIYFRMAGILNQPGPKHTQHVFQMHSVHCVKYW